jgi:uncharacterized spore protein YtfJ
MENDNFIQRIVYDLSQSASIRNVFGDPVQAENRTIIPVAKIAYGFGGGHGQGTKRKKPNAATETGENPPGEGEGAGGGVYASPKGVYEVTANGTRFIPADNKKLVLAGILIGFLLKAVFFSKRCRK